jgi:hypothetical protein
MGIDKGTLRKSKKEQAYGWVARRNFGGQEFLGHDWWLFASNWYFWHLAAFLSMVIRCSHLFLLDIHFYARHKIYFFLVKKKKK